MRERLLHASVVCRVRSANNEQREIEMEMEILEMDGNLDDQKSLAACFCFLRFHPGSLAKASRVMHTLAP